MFVWFTNPQSKRDGSGGASEASENIISHFFWVVEQTMEVNIIHQCCSDYCWQSRETPPPFQPLLHHHQQQVCDEPHPDLNFGYRLSFSLSWRVVDSLEKEIGEQCDDGGIDYMKPFHPFGSPAAQAARRKCMEVSCLQIAVYGLENNLEASFVGIGECTATYLECNT